MSRIPCAALLGAVLFASPAIAASREFPVGGFDRLRSAGPFDVRVHTGSAPSVRAEGARDAIDRLTVEVRGGELTIVADRGRWWSSWSGGRGRVVIDVTVPMLNAATLSGPGDLAIDRVRTRSFAGALNGPGDMTIESIEADMVALTLSGPGDIRIAGRAGSGTLVLRGPGNIHAAKLALRDATVALSGPGDIDATASGAVTGSLSGPGDITIGGGARCAISKRGPGDVTCR